MPLLRGTSNCKWYVAHVATFVNLPIQSRFLTDCFPATAPLIGANSYASVFYQSSLRVLPSGVGFSRLPAPVPTSPHAPVTLQITTSARRSGGRPWQTGHSPNQNAQHAWQTLAQDTSIASGEAYPNRIVLLPQSTPLEIPQARSSVPLRLVPTMAGMLWSIQYITGTEPNPGMTCAKCR